MTEECNCSSKLDDIITLLKIIARERIEDVIGEINQDPATKKIINIIEANQPILYSILIEIAMKETGLKQTSIKNRLTKLKNSGVIRTFREGKNVYYYLSDLFSI